MRTGNTTIRVFYPGDLLLGNVTPFLEEYRKADPKGSVVVTAQTEWELLKARETLSAHGLSSEVFTAANSRGLVDNVSRYRTTLSTVSLLAAGIKLPGSGTIIYSLRSDLEHYNDQALMPTLEQISHRFAEHTELVVLGMVTRRLSEDRAQDVQHRLNNFSDRIRGMNHASQ